MSRRRQKDADTGRGSPWDLAKAERNMILFETLVPEAAGAPQSFAAVLP